MAKNRLGKGLSALIPKIESKLEGEITKRDIVNININEIYPNENQPRKLFDKEKIQMLSESIKRYGVLQPILVKKQENGYMIVAGERRFRASKMAGLKEMPCVIKELTQRDVAEIALIENLQREDLNAIEEALAYKSLIENYNVTQEEISEAVGKSRPHITNTIRLLNLDQRVIKLIENSEISPGHGKALLRIQDKNLQYEVAQNIIKNGLSVRETENIAKNISENKPAKINKKEKDPFILSIEEKLKDIFGTKVNILTGKKKGKIEIEYYDEKELENILAHILNE
ncbi:chromosome partitioning protein, ParB family [Alkalithermobacter thermoalcaliphilus JW-YL-7 = DSM 7308]|uniref:Chromosome partitioning protein, ParB family n=1 Tax=Alkalithermobacter thermoalcaliphilus JW-YL-7 = DSM 7308 TaxID=1121328 RepID=A0A150FSZ6_CLOPD|nr:parB-like partition protein [[Clostridium] paradoxum JW-YL-7 = DSM 7308]SHL08852.1 chromosome partitioning protein, ParB family [[Clostridium] paradoxum JW-YL-7 = DSM 7308]